jgi:hypothetical protein
MGRGVPTVRDIPWFRPRTTREPFFKPERHSDALEAYLNDMADATGAGLFTRMYAELTGELHWADDAGMPAPYRVVRGWQHR